MKNRSEVQREYQDEKWGRLLAQVDESPWPLKLKDLDDIVAALGKVASGARSLAGQDAEAIDASRMAEDSAA